MKVEIKNPKSEKSFPKLMICVDEFNKGLIVLFSSIGCGTALNKSVAYVNGYYSSSWVVSSFQDFEGSITLSND